MKLCLLNVLHEALDKRMYQKIARSLLAAGHEVVSICPGVEAIADADGTSETVYEGMRFVPVPTPRSFPQRLAAVVRLIKLGRRARADIYIAPEPESWVAALAIKLFGGGKIVLDMHEHIPSEFAKFFPSPVQKFIAWTTVRFMRIFARFTDLIILTRESFDVFWTGLKTPRVTVINTNHLQPQCDTIPEPLQREYADRPTLIHQGIFGDIRGSYQLLEAMKRVCREIPDARCIVLGRYAYGDEETYRQALREAGLEQSIIMLDVVPYEEVPAYIAVSRIGLILFQPGLPNHTLAMPHKLFDYMREAKPVIVPDFSLEVSRIVKEGDCGILVDITSPEAIAGAILELLRRPEKAERLGCNGRRLVEDKYNWQQDEKRLIEAINRLG
jgi:glycosyltransferase involved in cell wall biosynthesis